MPYHEPKTSNTVYMILYHTTYILMLWYV